MTRRLRSSRRTPATRCARHRRERHARPGSAWDTNALAVAGAGDVDTWGAAALELGLVAEAAGTDQGCGRERCACGLGVA